MKEKSIAPYLIIFIAWLLVHVALYLVYGIRHLHDADYYLAEGRFLIQNGYFNDTNFFYLVPVLIFGIFQTFAGGILVLLVFQSLFSLIGCVALYRSSMVLFNNNIRAGLATVLIFLLWWDCIHWNMTTMTESLFCSLICILVMALVQFKNALNSG
jgi:hypothetical protein